MPINGNRQTILTVCEDINDLNYILIRDVLFIKIGDIAKLKTREKVELLAY